MRKPKSIEIPLFRKDGTFFGRINYPENEILPDIILAGTTNIAFIKHDIGGPATPDFAARFKYTEGSVFRPEAFFLSMDDGATRIPNQSESPDQPNPLPEIPISDQIIGHESYILPEGSDQ